MARARNIKPGFFKNELLVELPFEFRLLFIGLWTLADREGRLEDRPKKIKMEVFPADDVSVEEGIDALTEDGFIVRYEANGINYIQILSWHKHQTPHVKEQASTIPAPCEHSACPSDSLIPDSGFSDSLNPSNTSGDVLVADGDQTQQQLKKKPEPIPVQQIVDLYHELLPSLSRVDKITSARRASCQQRWRDDLPTLDAWRNYFQDVAKSPFLLGRGPPRSNGKPWRADFEWLCKEGNFAKVLEGKYHS